MVEILGHSCKLDKLGNRFEKCFRCKKYQSADVSLLIEHGKDIIFVCAHCFEPPNDEIVFLMKPI